MSHRRRNVVSGKQKVLSVFSKHLQVAKAKSYTGVSACRSEQAEEQFSPPQRMKRLKTRKERDQIRGHNVSSCRHSNRGLREKAQRHDYHLTHPLRHGRKEKLLARPFPPPGKPSIITEGRLTSLRGIFSHAVTSEYIERLVKDQETQGETRSANDSPSIPSPLNGGSETGTASGGLQDGQRCSNEVMSEQVPPSALAQEHSSAQTCHQTTDNTVQSGSPSGSIPEPVMVSSSANDLPPPFSTPANRDESNVLPTDRDQTAQPTAAVDLERRVPAERGQSRSPRALFESQAVGRLAARLCQALDSPPTRRCCSLLTECRDVLLQTMQDMRTFKVFNPEIPDSSHITDRAGSSSGQRREACTPMHSSFTWECEGGQWSRNVADNSSRREFMVEDFGGDTERGAVSRKRRRSWWTCSPQDFTQPWSQCEDMWNQWTIRGPSPGFPRAEQRTISPAPISLHQAFPVIEIPTPTPFSSGTSTLFFPQKQAHLGSTEIRGRKITELFDQRRNDPDLDFMFSESTRRTQTAFPLADPLAEGRDWSPLQRIESASERSPLGSLRFRVPSPEGFPYKPFFLFPHPLSSVTGSARSGVPLHNHSDIKESHLSSSLLLTSPYSRYLP